MEYLCLLPDMHIDRNFISLLHGLPLIYGKALGSS